MRAWKDLTYQELYDCIGMDEVYTGGKALELAPGSSESEKRQRLQSQYDQIKTDVSRIDAIDEANDSMPITNAWLSAGGQVDINYAQLDSGRLAQLFNTTLATKGEIHIENDSTDCIWFNYQDDDGRLCNFSLLYLKEKPDHWLLVILANANHPETEKKAFVGFSGFHPALFSNKLNQPEQVVNIYESMQEQINASGVFALVKPMFSEPHEAGVCTPRSINPEFKNALYNATFESVFEPTNVLAVCRVAAPQRVLDILSGAKIKDAREVIPITDGDSILLESIYLADTDRAYTLLCQGYRLSGRFNFENIYNKTVNHLITFFSYLHTLADVGSEQVNYEALSVFIAEVFSNTPESEYGFVREVISRIMFSEKNLFEFMSQASYSRSRKSLETFLASKNIFYDNGDNPFEDIDLDRLCEAISATVSFVSFSPSANTMVVDSNQNMLMRTYHPTYEEAFTLVKCGEFYSTGGKDYQDDVRKDLYRDRFVDEYRNADFFTRAWRDAAKKPGYLNFFQGDMRGGPFLDWFYTSGLQANGESPIDNNNKGGIGFGYCDDSGLICGLNLVYEEHHPTQWMLSVMRNANCPDAVKQVWINTCGWNEKYFELPKREAEPMVVDDLYAEIKKQINASSIFGLFKHMIVAPEFRVNEGFLLKFKEEYEQSLNGKNGRQGEVRVVMKPSQLLRSFSPATQPKEVRATDKNARTTPQFGLSVP